MSDFASYVARTAALCGRDREAIKEAIGADLRARNPMVRDMAIAEAMALVDVHDEAKDCERHAVILSDGAYTIGGASRNSMVSEVDGVTTVRLSDGFYSIGRNRAA